MKSAFTIIEVMIAVMLLSVVGWGVLQSQQGNNYTIQGNIKAYDTALLTTPVLLHANQEHHNKERTLYEFVRDDYDIKHRYVIEALKKDKIAYTQREYEFISFEPPEANTTHSRVDQGQISQAASGKGLYIDRVIARTKQSSASVFVFRVNQ